MEVQFSIIFAPCTFSLGGERHGGQSSQDQGWIWEEAECHEQRAAEAAVGSEGARPPAQEPITVWEAAEEASDGCGRDEEDKGLMDYIGWSW